jgi:hypothetical protein
MSKSIVNSTVALLVILWTSFLPFLLIFPRQELFEVLNAIIFSVSIGIIVGYAPGVWDAMHRPLHQIRAGDALQIGIVVGWLATAIAFSVLWYWRLTGKETSAIDSGIAAFSRWMLTTAGFMHLAASGAIDGMVPLRSYIRAGVYTGIGVFIGVIVITVAHGMIPVPRPF